MDQSSSKPRNAAEYRQWYMTNKPEDVAFGECWCGCKRVTRVADRNDLTIAMFKGEPNRYIRGHNYVDPTLMKQPTRYVEGDRGFATPCWIWQLYTNSRGYAQGLHNGQMRLMHRAYYEDTFGPLSSEQALHHLCRVRCCVNPEHVRPVTAAEHARLDRRSKLSFDKARRIRALYASGDCTQSELAAQFGVATSTISDVLANNRWTEP